MFARFVLWSGSFALGLSLWAGMNGARADYPDPNARCTYGPDGKCYPNSREYGYYPTHWRRWPTTTEVAWEEPKLAAPKPASRQRPSPLPAPEETTPDRQTPPPPRGRKPPAILPEESSLEPEYPPKKPSGMPDDDLPPRPPLQLPPPQAIPELPAPPPAMERPAVPELPPPANPPAAAPPAMPGELPQPSVDQDLRNLLPEDKTAPKKGPKSLGPTSEPPAPPPQMREDPFRDDPLPSERPANPKSSKQTPRANAVDPNGLTRAPASRIQWRKGQTAGGSQETQAATTVQPTSGNAQHRTEIRTLGGAETGSTDRISFEAQADEPVNSNPLRAGGRRPVLREEPTPTSYAPTTEAPPAFLMSGPGWTQNPLR